MKKDNIIKSQQGFSLLEILVALSILGAITAISIPGFNKYRRSSKQTEAKIGLSNVYMSQKSFKLNYGGYTHDLLAAGIRPEGRLIYNVGFSNDTTTDCGIPQNVKSKIKDNRHNYYEICKTNFTEAPNSELLVPLQSCAFEYEDKSDEDDGREGFKPPNIPSGYVLEPIDTSTGAFCNKFSVSAIGHIKSRKPDPSTLNDTDDKDIWSIDQDRIVNQVQDGT